MKSSVELNRLLLQSVLLSQVRISKESSRKDNAKIQLSSDNLRKQNVLEKDFKGF